MAQSDDPLSYDEILALRLIELAQDPTPTKEWRQRLCQQAAARIRELTKSALLPNCDLCGKPQTKLGALDLEVGPPDSKGICVTRKKHIGLCCYIPVKP